MTQSNLPTRDQAQAPAQSPDNPRQGQQPGQPPASFREATMRRLAQERGESPAVPAPPAQAQRESTDQPHDAADLDRDSQAVDDYADEEQTHDESQPWADQPDDEAEGDDIEQLADDTDADAEPGVFTVDGNEYTTDDFRQMQRQLAEQKSKWDVEFRKRTQITGRLKREYEALGEDLNQQISIITRLANANVNEYANYDPSNLTPEQYRTFHQHKQNAEAGAKKLNDMFDAARQARLQKIEQVAQTEAAESVEVLKGIEPRWNDEFYTKLREFAVETGRYSAEEFENISDWRPIEGLIALYDNHRLTSPETVNREPKKPNRRRRNRQRRRRNNATGQFQSAQQAVLNSPNAKGDGSFREYLQANLRRERGE